MTRRLLLALGLVAVGLLGAASAYGEEPAVRVRLLEAPAPLRVEGPRGAVLLDVAAEGVRAGGAPARRVWRGSAPGPWRVGGLRVRGALEARRSADGALEVVNEVPLESYVAATLGRESYPGWEPAVLRAQAIAIRTYALHQRARQRAAGAFFDVEAGTASQVYGGVAAEGGPGDPVWEAVRATRGEVLVYRGRPILAAYHSASGGRSASAEEVWGESVPYLAGGEVEGEEDSPDTYWRVRLPRETLRRALAATGRDPGSIREVTVEERSASGRVRTLRVRGSRGSVRLDGRALRQALGPRVLRSTLFEVRPAPDGPVPGGGAADDLVFVGTGNGHGVGMSQWGARALAARGHDHRAILAVFYPGTRVARRGDGRRAEVSP